MLDEAPLTLVDIFVTIIVCSLMGLAAFCAGVALKGLEMAVEAIKGEPDELVVITCNDYPDCVTYGSIAKEVLEQRRNAFFEKNRQAFDNNYDEFKQRSYWFIREVPFLKAAPPEQEKQPCQR